MESWKDTRARLRTDTARMPQGHPGRTHFEPKVWPLPRQHPGLDRVVHHGRHLGAGEAARRLEQARAVGVPDAADHAVLDSTLDGDRRHRSLTAAAYTGGTISADSGDCTVIDGNTLYGAPTPSGTDSGAALSAGRNNIPSVYGYFAKLARDVRSDAG